MTRTRYGLLLGLVLPACAPAQTPVAYRDYALEADTIVHGLGPGRTCRNDRDCQEGQTRAVCTLGTCFGLLTTDERVTRALLVERLAQADKPVQLAAMKPLLAVLASDITTTGQKLAAVDGLAVVHGAATREDVLAALRLAAADANEALAADARLALGRLGDVAVRPALREDLTRGTELLRAEAAAALQGAVADPAVKAALVAALGDASPVVQLAALRALTAVAREPAVTAQLTELAARTPAFRYEVEQLVAGGAK